MDTTKPSLNVVLAPIPRRNRHKLPTNRFGQTRQGWAPKFLLMCPFLPLRVLPSPAMNGILEWPTAALVESPRLHRRGKSRHACTDPRICRPALPLLVSGTMGHGRLAAPHASLYDPFAALRSACDSRPRFRERCSRIDINEQITMSVWNARRMYRQTLTRALTVFRCRALPTVPASYL
eukprot:6053026-Pleurochrysis_carterae.AAC.1